MMDTGQGKFEQFDDLQSLHGKIRKYPNARGIFIVGEELEIRGSRFLVKDISPYGIKLKLLKVKEGNDV